jgi:hypothetical protein
MSLYYIYNTTNGSSKYLFYIHFQNLTHASFGFPNGRSGPNGGANGGKIAAKAARHIV